MGSSVSSRGRLTAPKALRKDRACSQRNYKEFRVPGACCTKDTWAEEKWGNVKSKLGK